MDAWVEVIALGGTIASTPRRDGQGVELGLSADDLVAAVPGLADLAPIRAKTLARLPSIEIGLPLLRDLSVLIQRLEAEGAAGVVVTQGTDTIEETWFALDLLHGGRIPVIVTGAMRNPSLPGPEGPANLAAAVVCAADPTCRDQGVLVAFDDTIHAASWVQKRDTTATGAFWSLSPLGWLAEGRPALRSRRPRTPALDLPSGDQPFVPILKPSLDELPRLLDAALHAGAAGLVSELSGGGHATSVWADALESAARHVPVVFASRTRGGRVLTRTYGQACPEIDLIHRGLMPAGDLDALKARLLLANQSDRFSELSLLSWRTEV